MDITRRKFLSGIGYVCLSVPSLGIMSGYNASAPTPLPIALTILPRGFVLAGVGDTGRILQCRINTHYNLKSKSYEITAFNTCKDKVVILSGSVGDPNFWKARELIQENQPYFLWLICLVNKERWPIRDISLCMNETVSQFHEFDCPLQRSFELIKYLENLFDDTSTSLVGFDLCDIKQLLKGRINQVLSLEYETFPWPKYGDFLEFVEINSSKIKGCENKIFSLFYRNDDDVTLKEINYLDSSIEMLNPVQNRILTCHINSELTADFNSFLIIA